MPFQGSQHYKLQAQGKVVHQPYSRGLGQAFEVLPIKSFDRWVEWIEMIRSPSSLSTYIKSSQLLLNSAYFQFLLSYLPCRSIIITSLIYFYQMDPKIRQVIETAMQNNADGFKSLQELTDAKGGNLFETCFSKNSTNPERFAECFNEKQKKIEDVMAPFQFKMMFFSKSTSNCLAQNKSVSDCTQQATRGIREVIENTKKNIERI